MGRIDVTEQAERRQQSPSKNDRLQRLRALELQRCDPDAKLGVIEEGAYADILLVDGNPLEDFSVVGTGNKWFDADPRPQSPAMIRIIMKDGKIYKNTL